MSNGRKRIDESSGNGKLLNDIETISKAMYSDKGRPRSAIPTVSSRSKSVGRSHLPEPKLKSKLTTSRDLVEKDDNNVSNKEKEKKSIWSWKGLKALTHVRNRRFNCSFTLQVHCIEGLPLYFDDVSLIVHWKRRDGGLATRPVRVVEGVAEFEEQLTHLCSVYGSRNGPHHSAKYEAKHFLLYASVNGNPELDLGKHRVDLTRLLPLTLEELEEEKSSGKWTTSYRLSGKAKGAMMNVSFGYTVIGNNTADATGHRDVSGMRSMRQNSASTVGQYHQDDVVSAIRRAGSLPVGSSVSHRPVEEVKDLHEVLPISKSELSESVNLLYQKLDEEKLKVSVDENPEIDIPEAPKPLNLSSDAGKENDECECQVSEFSVIEQGIELSLKGQSKSGDDNLEAANDSADESVVTDSAVELPVLEESVDEIGCHKDEKYSSKCNSKEDVMCTKESLLKELESALSNVSDLAKDGIDSQEDESELLNREVYMEVEPGLGEGRKGMSLSLDDVTDSVASEFLDMLGIEHSPFGLSSESEPESPRERLLRQFEKDALASGYSLFDFDMDNDQLDIFGDSASEKFDQLLEVDAPGDMPNIEQDVMRNKPRASTLEDLENEALMRQWGMDEKAFQSSPPNSSGGFGSPIDLPPEEPPQLPPLAEGLGPFVQTENGGFLRSMNPQLFRNAKSGGSLIMQVSSPVVVPAEMGSGIMDILQRLASVGIEKLSMQANKLMPLEDVTGKTMQQIAWEAAPALEGSKRQGITQHESEIGQGMAADQKKSKRKVSGTRSTKFESSSTSKDMDSGYVSLEELAPMAMDKIEALSIEGLRIQSGMSDEEAPSNISPQSIGEFSAFEGKRMSVGGSIGLDGAGGLQLLDIKDNGDDVDGLMGLSLTLEEWMKLDSGEIDDGDHISERTSKLLAAHHATSTDLIHGRSKGEKRRAKGRKCGLLGNNFTVALMVQLRDPLRDYEPVGAPMLALIQVERVFVPPKPKMYSAVSFIRHDNDDEAECEPTKEVDSTEEVKENKIPDEELIPQFKITEVHVAGLKADPGKKKLWGSTNQQQSGSRWLLANGMGKKSKHPLMKSKAAGKSSLPTSSPATTTVQPGDTLWSISSRVHGTGAKWKELAALNPHIRNPNVIFPNEKIRFK